MTLMTAPLACDAERADLPLREGIVELWTVVPEQVRDPELLAAFLGWLDPDEEERYERFVFARDAHSYLVGHALLRGVLARHAGVAPGHLQFRRNHHGRPELCPPERARGLRFNLSRTAGMTVLAVARRCALGVDVEFTGAESTIEEVAEAAFTRLELEALRGIPVAERPEAAYRLWTLKEAYLKARGIGLSAGPESVGFELLPGGKARGRFPASLRDRPDLWQFASYRPTSEHCISLALRRGPAPEHKVVWRRFGG
jgi:4'-phosphopantetheinyl transferase